MIVGEPNVNLTHCILKNTDEDKLRAVTEANLTALENMIEYNIEHNIRLFRISSDIIPLASHPINTLNWQEVFKPVLDRIGQKIKAQGIRVSMHPGQYTVLNSPNFGVFQNAIEDLCYHAAFLDALSTEADSKIILHVGGVYGDKRGAMQSFIDNYTLLPKNVKRRLVIENDDKNYSVEDVLFIAQKIKIPVVFDNLHHLINPPAEMCTQKQWIELCENTWSAADGKQKIHYSQNNSLTNRYAHSDFIKLNEFLTFYNSLPNKNIDIMLEVKDKNLSAIKCINALGESLSVGVIEREWARYKYLVLSKGANIYNEIRELLKDKKAVSSIDFYRFIEKALLLNEDKGAQVNAAQHVWGYLNKACTKAQLQRYNKLLDGYVKGTVTVGSLKKHLFKCASEQDIKYLMQSYYFYL